MKIDKCLVASDLNLTYYDIFPLVKQCWKNIVGIDTIMILISDRIPEELERFKENIILFSPIENIPTAFQAQCIRILYPCLFKDENIIISDMDLVPLNKEFYLENVKDYDENSFIIYRDVISEVKQYPICFCLGKGQTWIDIFGVKSENDIRDRIKKWYMVINDYIISSPFSIGWAKDQIELYKYVNNFSEQNRIKRLKDEETGFNRLDRLDIKYINKKTYHLFLKKIDYGIYSDFHLPRPIREHKIILDMFDELFIKDNVLYDADYCNNDIIFKMETTDDEDLTEQDIRDAYIVRDLYLQKNDYYYNVEDELKFKIYKLDGNSVPNYYKYLTEEEKENLLKIAEEKDIVKFYNSLDKDQLCVLGW